LRQFVIESGQPEAEHVLNRAGALTCGGCHEFTATGMKQVGKVQGQPICWPTSQPFVHVEENGDLSIALKEVFLPFRRDRLGEAVCIPASPTATVVTAQTVLDSARQTSWQELLAAARAEKDEAIQRAIIREAVEAITVQRREQIQKPGYFVTNRRTH
jgi:hypothetical protein